MAKREKYYRRKEDGLYEAIRTINGKRVAFRGKTCREVDRKMLTYQEKQERGRTFCEVSEAWYESRLPGISKSTAAAYENALKAVNASFRSQYVKEVKPIECQRILENMAAQGFRLGTVKLAKTVLIQVFRYAVIQGDIDVSPAAEIAIPRGLARQTRDALTAEQIKAVTECRSGDWWLMGLAFLWTGCRRGELMALRYEDIDRKAGTITINKKYNYVKGKSTFEDHTKTDAGMRTIPLLAPLANALPKGHVGLIFHNADGSHLEQHQIKAAWEQYRKDVGLPDDITPHYFRHTFATICYNAGIDTKQAAAMLGHANERITMELYTHLTTEKRSSAADMLEAYAANAV